MGEGTNLISILTSTLILISSSKQFGPPPRPKYKLVVWDTLTGVVIGGAGTGYTNKIIFHDDQRTITSIESSQDLRVWTYDVFNGILLSQGEVPQAELGGHWIHKGALWLAIFSFKTDRIPAINICKLQPTSPSLFPMPPHGGKVSLLQVFFHASFPTLTIPTPGGEVWFSFSPVSFHASFLTQTKITILNVQDSSLLL